MSIFTLLKEFPEFNIKPDSTANTIECKCGSADGDIISHSKCRYCKQVWCPATLNQDWCPNPDCSHGIKGCNFQPWDEHNKWLKCASCELWFKNNDILAVHNCYIKVIPGIGVRWSPGPGIGGEGVGPIVEQTQSPPSNEPEPEPEIITSLSSPIEEHTETETEEEETRGIRSR